MVGRARARTPRNTWAQKTIHCPDGDHVLIDVTQIAIQYDASAFAGTVNSLSVLGLRVGVAPKQLQEAAAAAQQWNEFLKGQAAGYNNEIWLLNDGSPFR
jgi:hypothetical protein